MNINEIPAELLLKIFQYIPQRDLYTKIALVCEYWRELSLSPILWRNVDYIDISKNLDHLYMIQEYVKMLSIRAGDFTDIFGSSKKMQFSNLKELKVSNLLEVSEFFFQNFIESCPRLQSITFKTYDTFKMKQYLTKLSEHELTEVNIEYNTFYANGDGGLLTQTDLESFFKQQPNLKKLALRGWDELIDEYAINTIFTPLNLTHLSLYLSQINDDDLCHIAKSSKQLRFLDISSCQVSDKGLCVIAKHCSLLENLRFGPEHPWQYSQNITDLTLLAIAENCLNIKCLSCSVCKNLQDEGVMALVQSCRNINCIILQECIQLTDKSLNAIGENSSLLQKAEFTNCPKISADGVYRILKSCPQIRSLRFRSCLGITNAVNYSENTPIESVLHDKHWLTKHFHLHDLALPSCKNISIETVLRITDMCPDLRYLNLNECLDNYRQSELNDTFKKVFERCRFLMKFKFGTDLILVAYRKYYK